MANEVNVPDLSSELTRTREPTPYAQAFFDANAHTPGASYRNAQDVIAQHERRIIRVVVAQLDIQAVVKKALALSGAP